MQVKSTGWKTLIRGNQYPVTVSIAITNSAGANQATLGTLSLESVQVDRSMTTDMPANTRFVSGVPAASAIIGISGHLLQSGVYMPVEQLFNPWNSASPFYLADWTTYRVTISIVVFQDAVSPDSTVIFTGVIDDFLDDHEPGKISISCVDDRSKLTGLPRLPIAYDAWFQELLAFGDITHPEPALWNSYVYDIIFNSLGYPTVPPDRPQMWWKQTNHGGGYPQLAPKGIVKAITIASATSVNAPGTFVQGKFHPQIPLRVGTQNTIPQDYNVNVNSDAHFVVNGNSVDFGLYTVAPKPQTVEMWVYNNGISNFMQDVVTLNTQPLTNPSGAYTLQFGVACWDTSFLQTGVSRLGARFVDSIGGFFTLNDIGASGNIPNDGNWHYVCMTVTGVSPGGVNGLKIDWWLDGTSGSKTVNLTAGTTWPNYLPVRTVAMQCDMPVDCISLTNEANPAAFGVRNAFALTNPPKADISLNRLVMLPDVFGQDPWAVLQQIADSEQAIAGFDELGVPFFKNRNTLATTASSRNVTSASSLITVSSHIAKSTVVTDVQVPIGGGFVADAQVVWRSSDIVLINQGETYNAVATLNQPTVDIAPDFAGTLKPIFDSETSEYCGYRACTLADGSGAEISNLTMTVNQISPLTVLISVYNPNNFPVFLVTPAGYAESAGSPALMLKGRPLLTTGYIEGLIQTSSGLVAQAEWPPTSSGGAVLNPLGDIMLPIPDNAWRQRPGIAQTLADDILFDLYKPKPLLENVLITIDPSLQIADVVTIVDPDRSLIVGIDAMINQITTNITADETTMALGLRAVAPPGAWIMGSATQSQMGTNTRV